MNGPIVLENGKYDGLCGKKKKFFFSKCKNEIFTLNGQKKYPHFFNTTSLYEVIMWTFEIELFFYNFRYLCIGIYIYPFLDNYLGPFSQLALNEISNYLDM